MTSALSHLVDMIGYARSRKTHNAHDRATVADLMVPESGWGLPDGLEVRWLGVAGFAISYKGTTILLDPYVSRITFGDYLKRKPSLPDPAMVDAWIPRADAVLVGHTHFDHAVDAPAVARRDGATVYGGTAARHLMGLHGLGDQAVVVEPHKDYTVGPFEFTFRPSQHSKLVLGKKVPYGGEITCEHVSGLRANAYHCGDVWGIRIAVQTDSGPYTLFHQGSADLIEDQVRDCDIDLFLCGIAGREFTEDYTGRIMRALKPRQVVITHHDDFLVPLGQPQGFAFGIDVDRFPYEVSDVDKDIKVVTLPEPTPIA